MHQVQGARENSLKGNWKGFLKEGLTPSDLQCTWRAWPGRASAAALHLRGCPAAQLGAMHVPPSPWGEQAEWPRTAGLYSLLHSTVSRTMWCGRAVLYCTVSSTESNLFSSFFRTSYPNALAPRASLVGWHWPATNTSAWRVGWRLTLTLQPCDFCPPRATARKPPAPTHIRCLVLLIPIQQQHGQRLVKIRHEPVRHLLLRIHAPRSPWSRLRMPAAHSHSAF